MPRKLKRVPPPAISASEATAPPEPIPTPQGEPPRPKIGRPSRADVEARELAARQAAMMKPEDCLYLTGGVLHLLAVALRGDKATQDEVEAVNGPLCAVLNKYPTSMKYAPEVALFGALISVGTQMRHRGTEKRKQAKLRAAGITTEPQHAEGGDDAARGSSYLGTERLWEKQASASVPESSGN